MVSRKVRALAQREFESCGETEPLAAIEDRMAERELGAIPVVTHEGRIRGILLRRDLAALRATEANVSGLTAADVCRAVTPVGADDSLEAAFESLKRQEVGRLPVMDGDEQIGIVTRDDLLIRFDIERRLGPKLAHLTDEISPRDVMVSGMSVSGYLQVARTAVDCIAAALASVGKTSVASILDFACGHGRVLRMLKAVFPEARIAACDVDPDAVEFCARLFGATPFVSSEDPSDVEIEGTYDLIWCGSLLTHVDEDRWLPFLELWRDLLGESGVAVFSVHGPHSVDLLRDGRMPWAISPQQREQLLAGYDEDGFAYVDYIGSERYGISISSDVWTRRTVEAAGLTVVRYDEDAWVEHDVVACVASGDRSRNTRAHG
jgi:CBS domain-containing protein/SAM-dependent methyltransferase